MSELSESHDREEWCMIGHLNYDVDAEIVASLFESQDIPVLIQGRNHRRMLGFVGGYIELRVLVPKNKESEGIQLLESYHQNRDNLDYEPLSDEEQQGERTWLWFNETSKKLGLSLFLSAFIGFGLASLSAGLWLVALFLGILQASSYSLELSTPIANLFSVSVSDYQRLIQFAAPITDFLISWVYLILKARSSKKNDLAKK